MTESDSGILIVKNPPSIFFTKLARPESAIVAHPTTTMHDIAAELHAEGKLPPLSLQRLAVPIPLAADEAKAYKDLLSLLPQLLPNVPLVLSACMIVGFVLETKELYDYVKANPHVTENLALNVTKWFVHLPSPIAVLVPQFEPIARAVKPVALLIETGEGIHTIATEPAALAATTRYKLVTEWGPFIATYTRSSSG
jgi:hypothetical protein